MPPALLQFCLYQGRGITHSYIIYQPPPVFLVILRLIIAVLQFLLHIFGTLEEVHIKKQLVVHSLIPPANTPMYAIIIVYYYQL